MKKNVLALSIATLVGGLGFAGAASAQATANKLEVAESGAGHILVVPYYSAQEGNLSVFHLTNTDTVNGKAVKVRFRGAANSDDVLDFQVFMSPSDVWTGIVSQNPVTGLANLLTVDTTCTLPALPAAGKDFVTDRLSRSVWSAADKAAQTREGYVEILNMADIPPAANGTNGLFKAVKHVDGKAPPCSTNAAVLNATADLKFSDLDATAQSYALTVGGVKNATADLTAPSGGLTGQWYIMNLDQNTTFSGVMPAVRAIVTAAPDGKATGLNVFSAQMEQPAELASADPLFLFDKDGVKVIEPQQYDVPDLSTPYLTGNSQKNRVHAVAQAKALTDVLLKKSVLNQYANDAELDAKTDWVLSMPTRRYTIAADYRQDLNTAAGKKAYAVVAESMFTDAAATTAAVGVTGNLFTTLANSSIDANGQICAKSQKADFWDREEQAMAGKGPVFSPGTTTTYSMCGEVAVLSFQEGKSAVGASLTRQNVKAPYTNGWGKVTFGTGVPVVGSAFMKLTNNKVGNGVVANYGVTWAHSYEK